MLLLTLQLKQISDLRR